MNDYFWIFLPYLFIGIKLLLAVIIFLPFLNRRENFTFKAVALTIGYIACIALISLFDVLYPDWEYFLYLLYFIISIYLLASIIICYKSNVLGYIFHLFSAVMLSSGMEALRACILDLQYFDSPVVIVPDTFFDVLITLCLMALSYGAIYFCFMRRYSKWKGVTPDKSIILLYILFSMTMPMLCMVSNSIAETQPVIAVILQLVVVFYAFSMLYLQYSVYLGKFQELQKKNEQTENEAIRRISRETFEMYNSLKENMDAINVKCHDLKHRLTTGNIGNDNWSRELIDSIDIYDRTIQTGNEELDTVLMYHQLQCHNNGITFSCVADGSKLSFMELSDIYTLFGNAMSNAEEYLVKLPKEKRLIRMYIKVSNSFMLLHFENYFEGELNIKDGIPVTVKDDVENHGFGVKSMKMVAEKYGGSMDIRAENHLFQLNFCFPLAN